MTIKRYETDAYQREMDAVVISCEPCEEGFRVVLDETVFFPEGGGQPADVGVLYAEPAAAARVRDVQEENGEIVHYTDCFLKPGSRVRGSIDWEKRLLHMRRHSGEHVLSGTICGLYDCHNIGFHMGKDGVTVDFDRVLGWEELERAERQANEVILENVEIAAFFPTEEELETLAYRSKKEIDGALRIVRIPGADLCACCGTHVRRTGEIGPVKITSSEHYKNGVRLTLQIGTEALEDYRWKTNQIREISGLLSVKPEQAAEGVKKMMEASAEWKKKAASLQMQLLSYKINAVAEGSKAAVCFETDLNAVELRKLADGLMERADVAAVFCGADTKGYQYVIGSRTRDAAALGKEMNQALQGRGGGRNPMIQGSLQASREEIEAWLSENVRA